MDNRPIGVFDSGVGGLTVIREIKRLLPNENLIYFGDTARVPYGTKSPETVTKYSRQIIRFLLGKNIKAVVIACNTASAISLNEVQNEFDIPIIGVVKPGAIEGVSATKNNKIGIIATKAAIESKAYEKEISKLNKNIESIGVPCSIFVGLAEEGWINNEITYLVAKKYLDEIKHKDIDTLILGCTHFPLLQDVIADVMGDNIKLVNPAYETAKELEMVLREKDLLSNDNSNAEYSYYLSDISANFKNISSNFIGENIDNIQKIDIEKY